MATASWGFQQIDGPSSQRKTLVLQGWNAPFGRPRQGPVIKELIRSRIQTTRYPGTSSQSRHAFGINWEPTEMHGRWMTKSTLGITGEEANDVADAWTDFVKDERTCRIAWGDIVSYVGYIEELELGRESEHEIAWRMKIQIDQRDAAISATILPPNVPVKDALDKTFESIAKLQEIKAPVLPNLSPDFLESLDDLAGQLNKPAAELAKLSAQFGDIEKAAFSTIEHFRGAITGVRFALVNVRDTILSEEIDHAILVRTAKADLEWSKYVNSVDNLTSFMLDDLNKMDRKAELAEKQDATKFVLARDGDSWEDLSTRSTGGPDRANEIRQLNGIRYGTRPEAGELYVVP